MPEKKTLRRAARAKREGKAATTQAGAFVAEEMEHAKEGKHRVKGRKQAIAIGLSKARRAGVKVPARGKSAGGRKASARTGARKTAARGAKKTAARGSARSTSRGGARKTTSRGSARKAGARRTTRRTTARRGGRSRR